MQQENTFNYKCSNCNILLIMKYELNNKKEILCKDCSDEKIGDTLYTHKDWDKNTYLIELEKLDKKVCKLSKRVDTIYFCQCDGFTRGDDGKLESVHWCDPYYNFSITGHVYRCMCHGDKKLLF